MNSHNSSHADNVELVFVYETNNVDQVESCIKLALKEYQYRKIKEIYQVDLDLIKKVTEMCDNLYLVAKRKSKKFKNKGGYYCMIQPDFDYSE